MSDLKPTLYVDDLERLTKEFIEHIHWKTFEEVENFTLAREELVKKLETLASLLTQTDKEKIKMIYSHDQIIRNKISELKDEANQWLLNQSAIKEQKSAYTSSYMTDSLFIDRKN